MAAVQTAANGDAGERAFTDEQVDSAQRLMEEVPRIEAALKTYLSIKLAEGLTLPAAGDFEDGAAEISKSAGAPATAASPLALQGCARVLLKALNALELPPAPQWGLRHPQGEDEAGFDYVARIGEYKVVQALWERARGAGQKPAKLLGRSSLRFAFPEVRAQLLSELSASATSAKASERELRAFIDEFGASVPALSAAAPAAAAGDGGSAGDEGSRATDADVIWATNVPAALAARQEARRQEAAERSQRQATEADFAAELRAAVAAAGDNAGAAAAESTVRIEEVAE